MTNYDEFKPGVDLHYKGRLYETDHLIRDANNDSRVGVRTDGSICTKQQNSMCKETGQLVVPKFRYLGPYYRADMRKEKVWN